MHSFHAHAGDVEIYVEAPSLRELFAEAGLALAEVLTGRGRRALPPPGPDYEVVSLTASDRDALLVEWLDELIHRAERDGKVFTKFTIESLSDRELVAGVQGVPAPPLPAPVRGATLRAFWEGEAGMAATVVLDV